MKISCYIIDDESDAIRVLKDYVEKTDGLQLVGAEQDPVKALDAITGPDAPEITFIDVDMRKLTGLDLAGMVNLYTCVVFTTAYPQYAIQAFEKEAFDYLLKPISYERFLKCIQRVKRRKLKMGEASDVRYDNFFNIKSEIKGRMVKLCYDDVWYIEGAQNYITIHTREEKHMTYLTMKEIEHHLPASGFIRVHRSYIVNVDQVKVIERNRLKLLDGTEIILGDFYKKRFLDIMDSHLIKAKHAS
ncbi:DNA-binding response regulator [Mucilaginibacter conchicola]|uniref:DNA-binding response regulator n=1 Tax=Mucilaginibacter conchicola TaxID=2303333 RepID=A0A372NNT6_9SPHI|nr:LytTR family DNA-binding domain-containing protein [Mucilaginibacter conchicola]RFZ90045.1 DNA-binding response regulator [Mucilaginibacter conchicola]